MRMPRFDGSDSVVLNLVDSALWFNSNAIEMTPAEHYMYVTKFCQLLACQCYSCGELKFCVWTL